MLLNPPTIVLLSFLLSGRVLILDLRAPALVYSEGSPPLWSCWLLTIQCLKRIPNPELLNPSIVALLCFLLRGRVLILGLRALTLVYSEGSPPLDPANSLLLTSRMDSPTFLPVKGRSAIRQRLPLSALQLTFTRSEPFLLSN